MHSTSTFVALAASLFSASLAAQSDRALTLDQPLQLGKTTTIEVAYPASAVGNLGSFILAGHFPGALSVPLPGWTMVGDVRFDLGQILATVPWSATGPGAGTASLPLSVRNDPGALGLALDVQTLDIDITGPTAFWSDNDLELVVAETGCGVTPTFDLLFPPGTPQEPDVVVDTPTAMITYLSDRARDRHAREAQFSIYDHWLPFYWEQRIAEITIIDEVAKGGSTVKYRYMTHDLLNPSEFRAFFFGGTTVASYYLNLSTSPGTGVTLVSTVPSTRYPGETEYTYEVVLTHKLPENTPLAIGDRIEVELSQFLAAPRNGRSNYYGTAFLYIVGEGLVPWYAEEMEQGQPNPSFDSFRLPDVAWLGGETTLPYQYSDEPEHRFKQLAGNIGHGSGHEFVLGRRLHHTDFGTGAHSELGNPPMTDHIGQLGPQYIGASCVACHEGNGRSLPPSIGSALDGAVVRVGGDEQGSPHPTLGDTLQPLTPGGGTPGGVNVTIEAESFGASSGVATEPTSDAGGGLNVTSIDSGDWLSFFNQPVTIPASGTYRISFRVASPNSGGVLAFEESGGVPLYGTVNIPNTGGFQNWQTVTLDVSLPAGLRPFGMNAFSGGFNLNWFRVESIGGGGGGGGGTSDGQAILDGYDYMNGTFGDGSSYQLRAPRYTFTGDSPTYFSVRNAAPLVGLGLLEAIDEATIMQRHDPCDLDGDGISGRASVTTGFATGQPMLGRFGWKATRASVRDQIARALNRDMGVASAEQPIFDGETTPSPAEVTALELDRMTRYVALLGVGARRDLTDPAALNGEQLFTTIGCAACHVPELPTGDGHPYGELRNQTIRPFTDLLLHDMGPGLADNMGDGDATGSEWRTAPLWNIGLTAGVAGGGEAYLHDGRARTLAEAILWHGGEGEAAKEAFRTLSASDRAALIAFLQSL